ncbi:hypothetical protein LOZ36_004654 [Ophidiomyces ophidiicola]|nr:hypothetical protein LOZ36_004654 [Ophidiomyces ophidiicola]
MSFTVEFSSLTRKDLYGVGIGVTSQVVRIADSNIVAKIPSLSPYTGPEFHDIEKRAYERLQGHPNILRCFGQSPPECTLLQGALLFEYHPNGTLKEHLGQLNKYPGRNRWPYQAVSALAYVHSCHIVHGDLGLHNLLLRDDGEIVLCDFAGSGLDGKGSYVAHATRYSDPLCLKEYPDEQNDVFALGTLLYELDQGRLLFDGLSDGEIDARLRKRQFPDLSMISLPLRSVIEKCWTLPGYQASDALRELGMLCPIKRRDGSNLATELRRQAPIFQAALCIGILTVVALTWRAAFKKLQR